MLRPCLAYIQINYVLYIDTELLKLLVPLLLSNLVTANHYAFNPISI